MERWKDLDFYVMVVGTHKENWFSRLWSHDCDWIERVLDVDLETLNGKKPSGFVPIRVPSRWKQRNMLGFS